MRLAAVDWFKAIPIMVGVALLALAAVPIFPATITAGLLYLFNDVNDPTVPDQIRNIGIGVSSLALSCIVSGFAIAKARPWVLTLSLGFVILGYRLLAPFRDMIFTILTGS